MFIRMVKVLTVNICIIAALFINNGVVIADDALSKFESDSGCFDIYLENNIVSLNYFFESESDKKNELNNIKTIPDVLLGRESWLFQLPITANKEMELGIFGRRAGWYSISGDSLRFYNEYSQKATISNWSYYDLDYYSESYDQSGLFITRKFKTDTLCNEFRGDIFVVSSYEKMEVVGQGRLTTDINNKLQAEIDGNYRQTSINRTGYGYSMSWSTRISFPAGLELDFSLRNLLSLVYFPSYSQENGQVDSERDTISPVSVSGFRETEAHFIELPLEVLGVISWPAFCGTIGFNIFQVGELKDYSIKYIYSLKNKQNVIMGYDPVMNNMSIGFEYCKGKIIFMLNSETGQIRGLSSGIRF